MQGILFIDIETVADKHPLVKEIPKAFLKRFSKEIADNNLSDSDLTDYYYGKAGLYAEFGKIVAVSFGALMGDKFHIRAYVSKNEKEILARVGQRIIEYKSLGGHNIKEFDVPYLMRRFLMNDLPVPTILDVMNKKPWEVPFHDTMTMWAGTQMSHRASLGLLCESMGVPSSKTEMDGSDVCKLYYSIFDEGVNEEEVLTKIGDYCNADNIAAARLFAKMRGYQNIEDHQLNFPKK